MGLLGFRLIFDDGHAADFGALHDIVTRHEVDHLGAHLAGQFHDEFVFTGSLAGITDQASQTDAAGVGIFHDALGDVIGCIHGHHFAGANDVDFLRFVFADGHRETAANHVAQHIVEYEVEVFVIRALFFQEVDGGDDAAARAADTRLRTAGLDTLDVAVAHF